MAGVNMNRRVTLETVVRSPDGAGGFSESWQSLGALWAGVEAVGSVTPRARITLRALPATSLARPEPGQRLREGSRLYYLRHVVENARNSRLLICLADIVGGDAP